MSKTEFPEDIAALARKVGKQFKSEQDLADFSRLLKMAVEAALGAEIDEPWVTPSTRPRAVAPVTAAMDRAVRP